MQLLRHCNIIIKLSRVDKSRSDCKEFHIFDQSIQRIAEDQVMRSKLGTAFVTKQICRTYLLRDRPAAPG